MEELNPGRRGRPRGPQRGDIMLVMLVFLLVCMLGLLVSFRDEIMASLMGGNNLARQRDVQVSDIATRQLEGLIQAAYGNQPLEIGAAGQAWMRMVAPGTAAPTATYWDTCLGNSDSTLRCASISVSVNGSSLPYTLLAVVQPTGRSDATSCDLDQQQATFYDLFIHLKEANGVTSSNTETVYRLCTNPS